MSDEKIDDEVAGAPPTLDDLTRRLDEVDRAFNAMNVLPCAQRERCREVREALYKKGRIRVGTPPRSVVPRPEEHLCPSCEIAWLVGRARALLYYRRRDMSRDAAAMTTTKKEGG